MYLQEEGKWMFTGGCSDVRIWDLNSSNPVCKRLFDCLSPVNAVSLHPNQVELAIGAQNGGVYLWDVKSDKHEQLIPEVDTSIQDVAISPNAMYMAAVNNKGNCFIWNLKTGDENQLTSTAPRLKLDAHKKYALRCRFSPDSNYLVTTSADSTARIYKTENFTLHRELKVDINNRWIWDAIFSNDSKYLFTASSDCIARLWKIETRTVEREYVGHQKAITAIAFRDEILIKS
jgi:target of rapamycin complex subunit LST8